ncbi:helix-turn-helix transcriptional regulator [Streptomyces carpinensis]|uniref:Helix-turn-helix transcriptional regulator n=1 Tax=Streptomyces carpinensis TaxID=66369 RepID=A0ABV1WDD1_9ACTN|nr:helix-turn-helix transcriptional regulator [Streptomyces carpinensis]
MSPAAHPEHRPEDLCSVGVALYERALLEGRVTVEEAAAAPCLVDFGLLHPAVDEVSRLEPVTPAAALHRLLRVAERRIIDERRHAERLAETFEPLLRFGHRHSGAADTPGLRVLSGVPRINLAITESMAEAAQEVLCIQPSAHYGGRRGEVAQVLAMERDQALLDRGGRIRTLYQHTQRHLPLVLSRYERLSGDVEARTLDELTDRLIVIDREVAFLPADADGTVALEVRHPALISYFVTTFDRLWRLAAPMYPLTVPRPPEGGVTHRQRAIASLLVEGHTDAVIADRLGMNVRTAREHIAKLAARLGSASRAQLGYLIGRSGILDREP